MSSCTCNKDPEVTCILHPRSTTDRRGMMDYDDKFRQMYEAKVERIAKLEQENERLRDAIYSIRENCLVAADSLDYAIDIGEDF